METAQEFMQRVEAVLTYPADDPHSTLVVVLIVITAAVLVALVLIAIALPARRRDLDVPDSEVPLDDSFYDPDSPEEDSSAE